MNETIDNNSNGENNLVSINKVIKILVVDDNIDYLGLTEEYLKLLLPNSHIHCFTEPEEVIKKLENGHYDIIVSDLQMPGMNGLELLEALRKKGIKIPFILFTRSELGEITSKKTNFGVNHFIEKGSNSFEDYQLLAKAIITEVERKHSKVVTKDYSYPEEALFLPD